ncbi:uncharacterized protein [Miscanthus floridulus]|uniref:uncharacterized protein n=1 Tax=Miscanthus floridulus TaxID=154761 RepID=UPI0034589374
MGRGPLDHLPDIGEMVPKASTNSPTLLGGGGGAVPGSAIARPGAEANTPEARALGKHVVSLVGSTAAAEQVAAGATQPPLCSVLSRKRPTEVPTLAPLKALKVNPSSTAHWVAEVQATLQRGTTSARVDPKEPATQGGAVEVAPTRTGEGAPTPHEGEAHESDGAEVPSVAEVEAPLVSEAKAAGAGASRTIEAAAAGAGAPATTEATMAEAGAPGTTEADVITVRSSA